MATENADEGGATTIVPDTKDWTWVLDRPCPDCGFDPTEVELESVGRWIRGTVELWVHALDHPDATVRPTPSTWSPLEYAAHVRDCYDIFDARLVLMLTEDDPPFPDWDQDAAAVAGDYAHQDPDRVAAELLVSAGRVADRFDAVTPGAADRPGRRSNGSVFTVRSLGRYLVHDVTHHLWDIAAVLD